MSNKKWKSITERNDEKFWLGHTTDDEFDTDDDEFNEHESDEDKDITEKWEKDWDKKFQQLYKNIPFGKNNRKHSHSTDAILSCPGCFSIVCRICKKHHNNKFNTWMAFEVTNVCQVNRQEIKQWDGQMCVGVVCRVCLTELGVKEEDDVSGETRDSGTVTDTGAGGGRGAEVPVHSIYHLFHVLPSYV